LPYPFPLPVSAFDARGFERRLRRLSERDPFLFPEADVPDDFRRSSILIAFWRDDSRAHEQGEEDLRVVLTKRAATLSGHPGQMSFPGGGLEANESWEQAALRETEEEVGIPRGSIEVLGRLDDAWSGAGHHLVPIVGWLSEAPRFRPSPAEVEEIHTPSIANLMRREAYFEETRRVGRRTFTNPILRWPEGEVFGLSTDLLIEALRWAAGADEAHGPARLESLRGFREWKEGETEEKED
jgi:8-oxo-dGTP pyrophosphatase MutT (NUDIX family)